MTNVATMAPVPREPKKQRSVRVSDADWDAALAEAERRSEYLSEAIVEFVKHYGRGDTARYDPPDAR